MKPRLDRFTGEKLFPVQVWLQPEEREAFTQFCKANRLTKQDFLRNYILKKIIIKE